MTAAAQFWLMKTEPSVFSIDDLERRGVASWEGVRNFQARNFMRDTLRMGDGVLIYHSSVTPPGVVGLATVCRTGYPDHFAFDKKSPYFDARSTPDKPLWFMVDVQFAARFSSMVTLDMIKANSRFDGMMVIRRGARLSIQPVEKRHYELVCRMARH